MELRFECFFEGRSLFKVVGNDDEVPLFTGTASQCKRFMEIHSQKLQRATDRDGRPRRAEPWFKATPSIGY